MDSLTAAQWRDGSWTNNIRELHCSGISPVFFPFLYDRVPKFAYLSLDLVPSDPTVRSRLRTYFREWRMTPMETLQSSLKVVSIDTTGMSRYIQPDDVTDMTTLVNHIRARSFKATQDSVPTLCVQYQVEEDEDVIRAFQQDRLLPTVSLIQTDSYVHSFDQRLATTCNTNSTKVALLDSYEGDSRFLSAESVPELTTELNALTHLAMVFNGTVTPRWTAENLYNAGLNSYTHMAPNLQAIYVFVKGDQTEVSTYDGALLRVEAIKLDEDEWEYITYKFSSYICGRILDPTLSYVSWFPDTLMSAIRNAMHVS